MGTPTQLQEIHSTVVCREFSSYGPIFRRECLSERRVGGVVGQEQGRSTQYLSDSDTGLVDQDRTRTYLCLTSIEWIDECRGLNVIIQRFRTSKQGSSRF